MYNFFYSLFAKVPGRVLEFFLILFLVITRWRSSIVFENWEILNINFPLATKLKYSKTILDYFCLFYLNNLIKDKENLALLLLYKQTAREVRNFIFPQTNAQSIHPHSKHNLKLLKNDGGLLLNAHFGNWENLGFGLRQIGISLSAFSQNHRNFAFHNLLYKIRRARSYQLQSDLSFQSAKKLILDKQVIAILWDQHFPLKKENSIGLTEVKGYKVSCSPLPILLATQTSCPVYFSLLTNNNQIRVLYLGSFTAKNSIKVVHRYWKVLTLIIQSNPLLWFGAYHRLFKLSYKYSQSRKPR